MNIFYIDTDPVKAAIGMVDKHVVKMILETSQLLSTAHRILDGKMIISERLVPDTLDNPKYRKHKKWQLNDDREYMLYAATHINHPSAVWCRESVANYIWLYRHLEALHIEYTYRYGKVHACSKLMKTLRFFPKMMVNKDLTPMPSCMAPEYIISDDPVVNYRNYYKIGKAHMHKWTKRERPIWLDV
jgi:hypothetical protein